MKTANRQAQHRSAAAEPNWMAGSPFPVALLDEQGVIVEANEALVRLAGRPMLGRETLAGLLGAGVEQAPADEGARIYRLRTGNGDRWVRPQIELAAGGAIAILLDVSAEHALLARFRADYAAREALMHAAEIGVWSYDPPASCRLDTPTPGRRCRSPYCGVSSIQTTSRSTMQFVIG
jgi:hypothetical protein